ncbi:hypothetical protein [Paraburkholderia bannensis]|uniref:hypothetical protein n=1 Tax=Paraburkholderia bannensis TaxID=765414 RepID=UPI002AB7E444|nr:hypothetical protein [Paraburkholderia bannensis]
MSSSELRPARRHALFSLAALATTTAAVAATVAPTASHAQPKPRAEGTVLMVVQLDGPNIAVDRQIAAHLQSRGYTVSLVNQDFDPRGAVGARLVVISSTVSAKDVPPGWRDASVPLLTWENDLLDDLAMSGKRHDVDFGEVEKERYLWLVNAPHPVSGGLPAGVANVFRKQAPMSWGKPGLGASIIATIYGQPEKAAIFTYEKGATMDYEALAPARRTMFYMDNDSFPNLSAAGLKLFDAAIDWTAQAAI